jgi:hypothetical protein
MVPENKQNRRYKQINFIDLQNNRHPLQHTFGNVYKASGNCQQRPLQESIAEPLSHVLGDRFLKMPLLTVSRSFMNVANSLL